MQSIYTGPEKSELQGKVIAIIRQLACEGLLA